MDPAADTWEPHLLDEDDFIREVQSFSFWFEAVEGYLGDRPLGHDPDLSDVDLDVAERDNLVTILCNYCVGETAALEASSGLVRLASNNPAQIFMGDTGSLALGGLLGTVAVATKHEIVFAIVGGLFVLEAASVIIQVTSFKLTGKRVFRMAPIHHHFEQLGWAEPTVVIRFWIISFVLALAGLATLKLR